MLLTCPSYKGKNLVCNGSFVRIGAFQTLCFVRIHSNDKINKFVTALKLGYEVTVSSSIEVRNNSFVSVAFTRRSASGRAFGFPTLVITG